MSLGLALKEDGKYDEALPLLRSAQSAYAKISPAQADQIRSELEFRQAQLRLQQLQNQIGIEVRNAQFALQQNRAKVEAARKGRDLAKDTFEIEQKKYGLGASTNYAVLQAQRDYAQAESNLVAAMKPRLVLPIGVS